jgi:hypothetical protein
MGFFFDAVANSNSIAYVASATFVTRGMDGLWDPAAPNGYSPGVLHNISGHFQAPGHHMYFFYNEAFSRNQTLLTSGGVAYIDLVNTNNNVRALASLFAYIAPYTYTTSDTFWPSTRKNFTYEMWIQKRLADSQNFFSQFNEALRVRSNSTSNVEIAVLNGMGNSNISGSYPINTWMQFVFTMEDLGATNDLFKVYKNGTLIYTDSTGNYTPSSAIWAATMISTYNQGDNNGEYGAYWLGLMRSYTVPLTQAEVTTNWNNTKSRFGL